MNIEQARTAFETAEAQLAALQKCHADHVQSRDILREEKDGLVHAALTKGGDARKRLDTINRELAAMELQDADYAGAIRQAQRNVEAAQGVVVAFLAAQRANGRLARAEEIPALLGRFDAAVGEVCVTANLIRARFGEADERNNWLAIMGSLRRALQGPLFTEDTRLNAVVYPPANRRPATETLGPIVDRLKRSLHAEIADANAKIAGDKRSAA